MSVQAFLYQTKRHVIFGVFVRASPYTSVQSNFCRSVGQSELLYAVQSDQHTWTHAAIACRAMGGHLAMPVDDDAQKALEDYVDSVAFLDDVHMVHIGLWQPSPPEVRAKSCKVSLLSGWDTSMYCQCPLTPTLTNCSKITCRVRTWFTSDCGNRLHRRDGRR